VRVLAVVFPLAHRAHFEPAAHAQGDVSAARARVRAALRVADHAEHVLDRCTGVAR
jgi:hypothetical protein